MTARLVVNNVSECNLSPCPCPAVEELKRIVEKQGDMLEEHQKRLYDGNAAFKLIHKDIELLTESINRNTIKVEQIMSKPAKRWDNIISQIISLTVAAFAGYLLSGGVL